jgi:hypothetical protein
MDIVLWLFMIIAGLALALGVAVLCGVVPGRKRHDGLRALALSASVVLLGIAHLRNLTGEDWVHWTAVALMIGALILPPRSFRREKPRPRIPRPSAQ